MTTSSRRSCDEIRMAALARLDGEAADLAPSEIEAHAMGCEPCRTELVRLADLHRDLGRVGYEQLDVDLWRGLRPRLAESAPPVAARDVRAIVALTGALAAWRLAQLLLDWPAPVVNSIVPLVLVVVVLWRLAGDPFAIRVSSHQLQEKGAS
jgi:hypothetical protein